MDIAVNTRMEAFVTHVHPDRMNVLKVWVQLHTDITDVIESTLYSLESAFRQGLNKVSDGRELTVGALYCARFKDDDKWYRANIIDVSQLSRGVVKTFFVDYGNVDDVSIEDIRRIVTKIANYPYQAQAFILANVVPVGSTWSTAALKFCEDRICNEEVRLHVVGHMQGIPLVNIFCNNAQASLSFHQELVREGHARLPVEAASQPQPMKQETKYRMMGLSLDECELLVVHVESSTQFWIHSKKIRTNFNWEVMAASLEAHCRSPQLSTNGISHAKIGQPCITRNDSKDCYARGQIESLEGKLACKVFFVDYGNIELKTLDSIFRMAESYMGVPAMAHSATLALESCSIEDEKLILSLNPVGDPVPIYGKVLGMGNDRKYLLEVSYHQNQGLLTPSSCPTPQTWQKLNLNIGATYNVSISHVVSAAEFYVQLLDNKTRYNLLFSEIQFMFGEVEAPTPLREFAPGLPCCVKSVGDSRFYRGEIIISISTGFILVYFVDTGKTEVVTPMHVFDIHREFLAKLPAQAVKCQLGGLTVQEAQAAHVTKELGKFESGTFQMQTVDKNKDTGAHVVNLASFASIPPVLMNEHLALLSKTDTKVVVPPPKLEKVESLFIMAFDSMHDFFGQLEKVTQEELDGLQASLSRCYGNMTSGETPLRVDGDHVGAFCCAPFSGDNCYYRGRILSKSINCVEVLFIDYGNKETMPLTRVKRLLPEFAAIPQIGISCHIADPWRVAASSEAIGKAILNESVSLEILEQDENYSFAVKFCTSETNPGLTKKLVSCGLIVRQSLPMLEYRSLSLEDEEVVLITNFTTPFHFWVQSLRNTSVLNEIAKKINLYVASMQRLNNNIKNLEDGIPCLARYPDDLVWYRSIVKSVITKKEIEVYFVDYGNSCRLQPSDLQTIPEELMEFPCQSIECCFADVRSVEFSYQVLAQLEEQLLNQAFPVRVLSHEFPIKLEFTLDSSKEILLQNGIIKTHPPFVDRQSSISQVNGEPANGRFNDGELDNGQWGDTPSACSEAIPAQRASSSGSNPSHGWSEGCNLEDSASNSRRNYRGKDQRDGKGNPKDHTRPSRWDPPPDEWGDETRQDRRSGSQSNDDRKSGIRNAAHRFVPPRMQRQEQETVDRGGTSFSSKTFYKSDSRTSNFPSGNAANGSPTFSDSQKPNSIVATEGSKFAELPKPGLLQEPDLTGQFKQVTVVHAVSPMEFYCHLAEHKVALKDLLSKLNASYSGMRAGECRLPEAAVGTLCCTQFSGDMAWYRARVVKLSGSEAVVSFIDYGNEETVKAVQLRALLLEFLGMPAQAVKCCLEGVRPTGANWTDEDCVLLVTATTSKTLLCQFLGKAGDAFPVRLVDQEQLKYAMVNYDLLARGQALPTNPRNFMFKEIAAGRVQSPYVQPDVELGSTENVSVVWVNDPSQFFCQLAKNASQMEALEKRLMAAYSGAGCGDPELTFQASPNPNAPCVALLCHAWYRAVALTITRTDAVVYFVDYGNVEVVATQEIKRIKPEFMDLPAQAYKCNLKGIRPFGKYWPNMDAAKFQKYFEGSLDCTFCIKYSRGFEVDLCLNGKDVAREMIADRLACKESASILPVASTGSLNSLEGQDAPVPSSIDHSETLLDQEDVMPIWKKFSAKLDKRIEVMFSYVNSPNAFYLQNVADESTVDSLLDALSSKYGSLAPGDLDGIAAGSLCVAQYYEDDGWYRAVVVRSVDENYFVRFIDFGNEEVIHRDKMRKISPEFVNFPQLAAECELHGFCIPAGGPSPDSVCRAFNDLIQDGEKRVMAEFKRQVNNKYEVALYDGEKDLTAELFASLDLPQSVVSVMPTAFLSQNLEVGESVEVFISHIVSLSEFWVQRACDGGDVNKLQDELNSYCQGCTEPHSDVAVGAPCLAQYSADENWYRAVVLAVTAQGIEVQFVDYGNCDVVLPDKVQRITKSFSEPPQFAVKCALSGLENCPQDVRDLQETVDAFIEASVDSAIALSANVLGQDGDAFLVQLLSGGVDVKLALNLTFSEPDTAPVEAVTDGPELTENVPKIGPEITSSEAEITSKEPDDTFIEVEMTYNEPEITSKEPDDTFVEVEMTYNEPEITSKEPDDTFVEVEMTYNEPEITSKEPEDAYIEVEMTYNKPEIPVDIRMEVYITSIISPSNFWIQVDSRSVELMEMAARLDEANKDRPADEPFELSKGASCIAQYSTDESWYRASILEVLPDSTVSVLFVDYGNVETVPCDSVRRLTEEFRDVPVFGHRCRLTRLKMPDGGAWTADVIETFKELLNYGEVVCLAEFLQKERGTYVVRLLNMGLDVTERLVETGKVEASTSPLQFVDEQTPEAICTKDLQEDTAAEVMEDVADSCDSVTQTTIQPGQESTEEIMPDHAIDVDLEWVDTKSVEATHETEDGEFQDEICDSQGADQDACDIHGSEVEKESQIEEESHVDNDFQLEEEPHVDNDFQLEEEPLVENDFQHEEEPSVENDFQLEEEPSLENDFRFEEPLVENDSQLKEEPPFENNFRLEEEPPVENDFRFEEPLVENDSQLNVELPFENDFRFEEPLVEIDFKFGEDSQVETECPETVTFEKDNRSEVESEEKDSRSILVYDSCQSDQNVPLDSNEQLLQSSVEGDEDPALPAIEETVSSIEDNSNIVLDKSEVMTLKRLCECAAGEAGAVAGIQKVQQLDQAVQTSEAVSYYLENDSGVSEFFEDSKSELEGQDAYPNVLASNALMQGEETNPEDEQQSPLQGDGCAALDIVVENVCLGEEKLDEILDSSDAEACESELDGESWRNGTPEDAASMDRCQTSNDPNVPDLSAHAALYVGDQMLAITEEPKLHSGIVCRPSDTSHDVYSNPLSRVETEKCNNLELGSAVARRAPAAEDHLQSLDAGLDLCREDDSVDDALKASILSDSKLQASSDLLDTHKTLSGNESFLREEEESVLSTDVPAKNPRQSSPKCDSHDPEDSISMASEHTPEWPDLKKLESCSPIQEHLTKDAGEVATALESNVSIALVTFSQEALQSQGIESQEECVGSTQRAEIEM